ncbi:MULTISPECIES: hypothetical protein [Sphingobium]|uniref:Uncharacterized protein n=2 Tax=Sphingobium cupriresistens TaxID=1132417 RepID=A0A0J7XKK2_9SPHN|nr:MULTISPECIES: hypothetical protein [Sphingobium]KMS52217.1 hypothetical protein V473_22305 [Sphingobium cupriresistens LL01]MBJ7379059.1 hypothetical protein [Sphingobium sp.]
MVSVWRPSFNRSGILANAALMTAGFVLIDYQLTGYFTSAARISGGSNISRWSQGRFALEAALFRDFRMGRGRNRTPHFHAVAPRDSQFCTVPCAKFDVIYP